MIIRNDLEEKSFHGDSKSKIAQVSVEVSELKVHFVMSLVESKELNKTLLNETEKDIVHFTVMNF